MAKRSMFVGMDVHMESIDISLAEAGRAGEVRHYRGVPCIRGVRVTAPVATVVDMTADGMTSAQRSAHLTEDSHINAVAFTCGREAPHARPSGAAVGPSRGRRRPSWRVPLVSKEGEGHVLELAPVCSEDRNVAALRHDPERRAADGSVHVDRDAHREELVSIPVRDERRRLDAPGASRYDFARKYAPP